MATKKETAAAQAVENAVETVEKTEAMAEAKAEAKDDGMVTIHLFKDDDRYAAPVFVGVNGDSYLIQRGMDVKVPKAVAGCWNTASNRTPKRPGRVRPCRRRPEPR